MQPGFFCGNRAVCVLDPRQTALDWDDAQTGHAIREALVRVALDLGYCGIGPDGGRAALAHLAAKRPIGSLSLPGCGRGIHWLQRGSNALRV